MRSPTVRLDSQPFEGVRFHPPPRRDIFILADPTGGAFAIVRREIEKCWGGDHPWHKLSLKKSIINSRVMEHRSPNPK